MVEDDAGTFADVITTEEFEKWLSRLRDRNARQRITADIFELSKNHVLMGDWKRIEGTHGIFEFRYSFGAGYRVYFSKEDRAILLLLIGSNKRDQKRAIKRAEKILTKWRTNR
jgi:putative addiction module killer protein